MGKSTISPSGERGRPLRQALREVSLLAETISVDDKRGVARMLVWAGSEQMVGGVLSLDRRRKSARLDVPLGSLVDPSRSALALLARNGQTHLSWFLVDPTRHIVWLRAASLHADSTVATIRGLLLETKRTLQDELLRSLITAHPDAAPYIEGGAS